VPAAWGVSLIVGGPLVVDTEPGFATKETSCCAKPGEFGLVKVAQNRGFARQLHGSIVIGAMPRLQLALMAFSARLPSDVVARGLWRKGRIPVGCTPGCQQQKKYAQDVNINSP
jgi:hypothetical protein